ncbi:DUF998 domain-containing protein [Frankia sp. R82]|uniref:DUF998 domain-containing protein n=1 Tax=Frankia sp. R82 TaxID=2950553 RepID=UPI0020443D1D|nr:DUF998 domain-containing protein [Frankia sp. R82]MCM3885315.1 DUF998 domain-containing protein [Frankia sp. R82]
MSTAMTLSGHDRSHDCADDRAGNVTRSLLGWLTLAGPTYLIVSVVQGLSRPGFDFARHDRSLLAVGHLGWIQMVNLILVGAMMIVGGFGVRGALGDGHRAGRWTPRLLACYGAGLVLAGIFKADPANGFPVGTPPGRARHVSWHGTLHVAFAAAGFACLVAACFMIAGMHARRGEPVRAWLDRGVGVLFLFAFAMVATGSAASWIVLLFAAAVIVSFGWISALAVEMYRRTRTEGLPR